MADNLLHMPSRRKKVMKNNMEYLLTVVEERHRNAAAVDIRQTIKESYRKYYIEKPAEDEDNN
jgi:hypothetical protein